MTVFPYPELDAEKEAEYELFPINLTRMLLHTKGLTVPYWKYGLSFRNAELPPVVRERVIVRVGAVADCEYQLVQHKTEALRTGTSQQLLADLINPAAAGLRRSVADSAGQICRLVSQEHRSRTRHSR